MVELLFRFDNARRDLLKATENADAELVSGISIHPRLKKEMRFVDSLFFVAEHNDHHLNVIRRLCRNR